MGKPPRQTEDPLSPPCIAYFSGDNFGDTAKGVTGSEIRVAYMTSCNPEGSTKITDLDDAQAVQADVAVGGADNTAALFRYFTDRFQTYGRRIHGWRVMEPCENPRKAVLDIEERVKPFAILRSAPGAVTPFATEAANHGTISNVNGGDRAFSAARAPLVISWPPDVQDYATSTVEWVCSVVAGRPAAYSGEPLDRTKQRRFALYYSRQDDPEALGKKLILEGLQRRCPDKAGPVPINSGTATDEVVRDLTRWRFDGITTVLLVGGSTAVLVYAEQQGWHPEWAATIDLGGSDAYAHPAFPAPQMANVFGIWFQTRLAERREEQDWYTAIKEACATCSAPGGLMWTYQDVFLLARGIQAAGPRLSPATFDRGLRTLPKPSPDPWTPAAYFVAGNWSFVKDAAAIRWDINGERPGSSRRGCWRLVEQGRRYRAEDWVGHPGDDLYGKPGWPCSG